MSRTWAIAPGGAGCGRRGGVGNRVYSERSARATGGGGAVVVRSTRWAEPYYLIDGPCWGEFRIRHKKVRVPQQPMRLKYPRRALPLPWVGFFCGSRDAP